MRRHELDEEQFKKIESLLPGREGAVGVTAKNNRNFIKAHQHAAGAKKK